MGYNTDFTGQVTITPPLGPDQVDELLAFADTRHDNVIPGSPHCKWAPTEDGTAIAWNGNEKFYYADLWLAYLVDTFLAPRGHVVNGVIEADGEEPDDLWRIEVRDNVVFVVRLLTQPRWGEISTEHPDDWTDEQRAEFEARTRRNHVFAVRDGRLDEVGPADGTAFTPITPIAERT